MSGFDFGSLRDPDAPQPDSRHRDAVELRAHELRSKARRNRTLLSGLAVIVVVAAVAGIVATRPNNDEITVRNPSSTTTAVTTPSSSNNGRFIPPTTMENGLVVLPVTFPDGETTTLRYPPAMKIAQLGFGGGMGVEYPVTNGALHCCSKVLSIRYATVAQVYGDARPVKVYRGANGEAVDYFHASQAVNPPNATKQDELAFQFGRWLVQVYDVQRSGDFELRMTDAQRATWARSLTGALDAHGYLVLHAQAPLSIGRHVGQESGFGAEPGNVVELDPHLYCGEPGSDTNARRRGTSGGRHGVSWCVDKEMHVSAHGTARFADLAARRLEIAPLGTLLTTEPATSTTTTTTTTPTTIPSVTPANASSATFVSAGHGWIDERDGTVTETTDGGVSWHPVGSLGRSDMTIRFADATHGFAFQTQVTNQPATLATADGGATWTTLSTPWSGRVYDLAISRGTVYAVTFDNGNFRIWSSPADNLSWTEDPITIPVGGGPDPSIQLVFSNGAGWLVEVDRIVVGGAQMSTTGTWSTWTPPCSTGNGPASLAAWSATDLIAACDEGVWGSPPAPGTAVYTSHDAGATFQRFDAPVFGSVAAADPNYALLVTGDTIRRSVDGGRTWTTVVGSAMSNPGGTRPLDLGFTSSSQGFVIFANGQMVMTRDAGATWSAVTQP